MQPALIAAFEVAEGDLERFLSAAKEEQAAVQKNEPGCLRFDIVLFDEAEGRGAFVEVFADEAAAARHPEQPHFKAFFAAIEDIEVRWTVQRGRLAEPL